MALPSVAFLTADRALGVDHWRVHGPAYHLQTMGHPVAVVPLGQDMVAADVLVASQRGSRRVGGYRHIRERLCRPNGMLLVVDCCDDPTASEGFVGERRLAAVSPEGINARDAALDAIADADLVTVNTAAMAAIVRKLNPAVEVVPDLIDATRWVPPYYNRPIGSPLVRKTYVGVAGGESHHPDWRVLAEVWPRIAAEYPGVNFVCIGYTPDYLAAALPSTRLLSIPFLPLDKYQQAYIGLDVGCAPLDGELAFNRSKSAIKWFEYSLAGVATVASPTVYGKVIKDGVTGVIARDPDEWYEGIVGLLDTTTRRRMVEAARAAVVERHVLNPYRLKERLEVYRRHYRRVYGCEPGTRKAA